MHEPPEERRGLGVTPELKQRLQRERGIAQPRKAIVPVAIAADALRQRRRGRGGDGAGWREHEKLQRERAPHDRVTPRSLIGERAAPSAPEGHGGIDPRVDLLPCRNDERLAVRSGHRQQRAPAVARLELAFDGDSVTPSDAGVPGADPEGIAAGQRDGKRAPWLDPRRGARIVEARLYPPAHRHSTGEALDTPRQLAKRP